MRQEQSNTIQEISSSLFINQKSKYAFVSVLISGVFYYWWIASYGTFELKNLADDGRAYYFSESMFQMLHGRLDIPLHFLVAGDLVRNTGECLIYGNKCFAYYGITPSLLRLPFFVFGSDFARNIGSGTAMIIQIPFLFLASFTLIRTVIRDLLGKKLDLTQSLMLATCIVFGPQIFLFTRTYLYEEAILVAIIFFLATLNYLLKFHLTKNEQYLYVGIILMGFTLNARVSEGFALLPLIVVLLFKHIAEQETLAIKTRKVFSIGLALILSTGTLIAVNISKFSHWAPDLTNHHGGTYLNPARHEFYLKWGVFDLKRGFETLLTWLLPNTRNWPSDITYTPGNYRANFYVFSIENLSTEQTEGFVSLPVVYPFTCMLVVIGLIVLIKNLKQNFLLALIVMTTLLAMFITSSVIAQTLRYGAEIFPFFLLLSVIGILTVKSNAKINVLFLMILLVQIYCSYTTSINFWNSQNQPDVPIQFYQLPGAK
jgi:hypothetical protein